MSAIEIIVIGCGVVTAGLVVWVAVAMVRERKRRLAMLNAARDRFDGPRVTRSPWRYPRIDGTLERFPARLDLIPDTLLRKGLPVMWGQLTWHRPHDGSLSVTIDPGGSEHLAKTDIHEHEPLPAPEHWPKRTWVTSDDGTGRDLLDRLEDLDLTAYPRVKQIVIEPQQVTLLFRCAYARRPHRVFIATQVFTTDPIDPRAVDQGLTLLREVERLLDDGVQAD